jgi:hypothetical protein
MEPTGNHGQCVVNSANRRREQDARPERGALRARLPKAVIGWLSSELSIAILQTADSESRRDINNFYILLRFILSDSNMLYELRLCIGNQLMD